MYRIKIRLLETITYQTIRDENLPYKSVIYQLH